MALPKIIQIKESMDELKKLYKNASPIIGIRIRALMEMKKAGDEGISKRELAEKLGVNHNSIQTWRSMYEKGGIKAICTHHKIGYKPSVFTQKEHKAIEAKLSDPKNGLRGYKELLEWVENEFGKEIKYNTLLKYSIRNFHSKAKVGRKSHIHKNEESVVAFKKTLVKPAKKSVKASHPNLKK